MRRRIDHERLDALRTSKAGIALFYGYLAAILIVGALVAYAIIDNRRIAKEGRVTAERAELAATQSTLALCNQRTAAIARLKTAQDFLADHPHGTADFSIVLINRSIATAKAEIFSLSALDCPNPLRVN